MSLYVAVLLALIVLMLFSVAWSCCVVARRADDALADLDNNPQGDPT